MKRSRNVALVIVGAAALGACGDTSDPGETVFQSLADCRRFYDEDVVCCSLGATLVSTHASLP